MSSGPLVAFSLPIFLILQFIDFFEKNGITSLEFETKPSSHTGGHMPRLISDEGRINPFLIRFVRKSGLTISDDISPEGMNELLQAHWIQRGKFRYEIQGKPPTPEDLALLQEIGCIDEVKAPSDIHVFDGALLTGAILGRVRTRLAFLAHEYWTGAQFNTVYLLGSERPLNPEKEGANDLQFPREGLHRREVWKPGGPALPITEIEMMQYVVEQSDIPKDWNIVVIKTPNVPLQGAGSRPANTGDTFSQWQKQTGLTTGTFLVVSNNPFVDYQETNARRVLPQGMQLFGIGPAANTGLPLGTFCDNLAKQLYEEILLRQRLASITT
jgi:hypothetical protein